MNGIEIIGYIASIIVAISLMTKKIWRLRVLNLIGAVFFVIYGFLINSYPIAMVNIMICAINILYLWKIMKYRDIFELLFINQESEFLIRFLDKNSEEINKIIPEFDYKNLPQCTCVLILRNLTAVGLFIYHVNGGKATIFLDYVVPEYRDFKNAQFLFSRTEKVFEGFEVRYLESKATTEEHKRYLEHVDFKKSDEEQNYYFKIIQNEN